VPSRSNDANRWSLFAPDKSRDQMGSMRIRALDDVTLEVLPAGEFFVPLGSSGSGKSTLPKTEGRPGSPNLRRHLRARPQSMNPLELPRYRRRTVGMVFQSFNLFPRMALEENIELPLPLAEAEPGEGARRVREPLEPVRLEKRLSHRRSKLSRGQAAARRLGASAGEPAFPSSGGRANRQP
jgi:putative ABC transport system ATP-binding protein